MTTTRGTTNRNERGSSYARAARRKWLVATFRANVDVSDLKFRCGDSTCDMNHGYFAVRLGVGTPACRCYRCGCLLTENDVTSDRIVPGCQGGTYARNNIRPACLNCNSITGGATRRKK